MVRYLRAAYLFCVRPSFRSTTINRFFHGQHYFQEEILTKENRYPVLFKLCHQLLANMKTLQILSYGCATGEEVKSLGAYFPEAEIQGVDINKWCVDTCIKKIKGPHFRFFHRFSREFELCGPFDAIFCLAVFQHTSNRTNSLNSVSTRITFSGFCSELCNLDKKLNVGGLLIIDHSDFNFMSTDIAKNYLPVDVEGNKIVRNRPNFNSQNMKICETSSFFRIFRKIN